MAGPAKPQRARKLRGAPQRDKSTSDRGTALGTAPPPTQRRTLSSHVTEPTKPIDDGSKQEGYTPVRHYDGEPSTMTNNQPRNGVTLPHVVETADYDKPGTLPPGLKKKLNDLEHSTHEVNPSSFVAQTQRISSPAPSDSSDEIIIFSGRQKVLTSGSHPEKQKVMTPFNAPEPSEKQVVKQDSGQNSRREGNRDSQPRNKQSKRNLGRSAVHGRDVSDAQEDALLASYEDYLDNIHQSHSAQGPDLGPDRALESRPNHSLNFGVDLWDEDDLVDFDDLSTSEGIEENISEVIRKRERPTGMQYLVVWQGQSIDEARWIPHTALVTNSPHNKLVEDFEARRKHQMDTNQAAQEKLKLTETSDEDTSTNLDPTRQFAFRQAKDPSVNITDEHLAKLLFKQEELGLGSNELLIHDGAEEDYEDTDTTDDDTDNDSTDEIPKQQPLPKGQRFAKVKTRKPTALNADDFIADGDDYGDFDVMDRERPSVNRRIDSIQFNVSDSDLEQSLQTSWSLDRKKKKAKKQEREELRAMGMLGNGNKKKKGAQSKNTSGGFGKVLAEVKMQLTDFLSMHNQDNALTLPPMNNRDRKMVHEIALRFGLKSKSMGKGDFKQVTISKTSRTKRFDEAMYAELQERPWQLFIPQSKMSREPRGGRRDRRPGGGSGMKNMGTGIMEGEIVGAAAPAIGAGNRGRAMLEKMGWSQGTALGALNNKGILQPVEHVVKKSKAGLG